MEIITDTQNDDQELTPEEEAEILGEEAEKDSSDTPAEEPETDKDEKTEKDGEPEPPAEQAKETETEQQKEKTFAQSEVESIIQERLSRHQRELQETNQQLTERIQALEKGSSARTEETSPASVETQDLGQVLHDPAWNGWTLDALRENGHMDHYHIALGRISAIQETARMRERTAAEEAERAAAEKTNKEVGEFRTSNPEYFGQDGKGNEKFQELVNWGAENGIYNLQKAHQLRNFDQLIENAKKQAIADYIKEATSDTGLKRASVADSPATAASPSSMSDEDLLDAYGNATSAEQERELEKEMDRRGLM